MDGLADIDELTPQAVRPGDRHTYWILGFSLDTERLGCSADAFADAVRHEGVLLIKAENSVDARHPSTGLPRMGGGGPLYSDPFLAGPDCYGRSRFPFDHGRNRAVEYGPGACPYGEALMGRTVGFNMWPNLSDGDVSTTSCGRCGRWRCITGGPLRNPGLVARKTPCQSPRRGEERRRRGGRRGWLGAWVGFRAFDPHPSPLPARERE